MKKEWKNIACRENSSKYKYGDFRYGVVGITNNSILPE